MSRSRALVTSSLEGAHASIHSSSSTSRRPGGAGPAAAAPLRGLTNAGSRQRTSVSTRSALGSARSWWRSGAIWVVSDHRAKRLSHGRGWPVTGSRSDVSWANSNSRSRSLVGCSDSSRRRPCPGSMTSCDRGWRPTRRMATPCAPIWSTILAWCAASTSCALRCSMTARYCGVRLCWMKHGVSRSPARIEASTVRRTSRALGAKQPSAARDRARRRADPAAGAAACAERTTARRCSAPRRRGGRNGGRPRRPAVGGVEVERHATLSSWDRSSNSTRSSVASFSMGMPPGRLWSSPTAAGWSNSMTRGTGPR